MQDSPWQGFKDCMKRFKIHIVRLMVLWVGLLLSACMKEMASPDRQDAGDAVIGGSELAVATLRSEDGIRFLQLDPVSRGWIVNPEEVSDIPDITRVFVQYNSVKRSNRPSFCTESVLIEWAMALDVGEISSENYGAGSISGVGDPVDLLKDWVTSLEDGFLTLHYMVHISGNAQHSFTLFRGASPYEFHLRHDAHGDPSGSLTDGIVCFPVEDLLPDTEGKTVELSLEYLDLKNKKSRLTVEYKSPK